MNFETTRRSIYLWFRLMLSLIYPEWSNDWADQSFFAGLFWDSLDPTWHYYMRIGQRVPDADCDF